MVRGLILAALTAAALSGAQAQPAEAPASSTSAQARAALTPETIWTFARIGTPTLSPDGRFAVASVTRFDMAQNKGTSDLWLFPTAGGAPRQLTTASASDSEPTFSPDGRYIAFVSKRDEDTKSQIWVIAVDGGEARRLTNIPTGAA
jgi:Tol biopolymer transport system component